MRATRPRAPLRPRPGRGARRRTRAPIPASSSSYEGALAHRFGNRKPPAAAYATQSPIFHLGPDGSFVGGSFGDGRATGEKLGDLLSGAEEADLVAFLRTLTDDLPDRPGHPAHR